MTTIHLGDCRQVLASLPDNSVDSIVTDPPYELGFMGNAWDKSGIAYDITVWQQCLRVLKPGGHLIAFGGSRTYHRMTVAIEDAGFEIRDCIQWIYGSGFPKSLDVSKAIDKQAGAEREVVGVEDPHYDFSKRKNEKIIVHDFDKGRPNALRTITTPSTDAAKAWHGWGTALKPANEPAVLARKPLIGTVADNVMTWGVGALNIDGCRVGTDVVGWGGNGRNNDTASHEYGLKDGEPRPTAGRWPANVIFDEEAAQVLDEQSGTLKSGNLEPHHLRSEQRNIYGKYSGKNWEKSFGGDAGGASRFFYVAKASKAEREAGLDSADGRANHHPTVKPIALMRYLVRMVTPKGGIVLDPFTGSGSTGCAAVLEGNEFIGIDINPEYVEIAKKRIAYYAVESPFL